MTTIVGEEWGDGTQNDAIKKKNMPEQNLPPLIIRKHCKIVFVAINIALRGNLKLKLNNELVKKS
jgi:hypothetical protein